MSFWIYGRDSVTGQPRDPLFIETDSDAVAAPAERKMPGNKLRKPAWQ